MSALDCLLRSRHMGANKLALSELMSPTSIVEPPTLAFLALSLQELFSGVIVHDVSGTYIYSTIFLLVVKWGSFTKTYLNENDQQKSKLVYMSAIQ